MKFSKKAILVGLLSFYASVSLASDSVEGLWNSAPSDEDGSYIQVEIAPCADKPEQRCGVITNFIENGESAESDIIGKNIIEAMKNSEGNLWKEGTIWAPDEDKTYKAKMELTAVNTLKVSGCILGGWICRGQDWTRAQ